jgi:hypothetical protein
MSQILALDANMIVLLVVGLADENAVPIHKRTRAYTVKDFRLLLKIISNYERLAVVPNALSEASNLLDMEGDGLPAKIFARFSNFIETTNEQYVPSANAVARREFRRLGLSDAAMLEMGAADLHILSADVGLYLAALKAGYKAFNFTHAIEAAKA